MYIYDTHSHDEAPIMKLESMNKQREELMTRRFYNT